MNDESFVPCDLRCGSCDRPHRISLVGERPIRDELAATWCPSCGLKGTMRLASKARPIAKARPRPHLEPPPSEGRPRDPEPPDMEGDEFLLASRLGKRWSDIQ